MKSEYREIYKHYSKDGRVFTIHERDGVRDYTKRDYLNQELAKLINSQDKLLVITSDKYPYSTEDLGEMIYRLLNNKVILSARQVEADKLYSYIRQSFMNHL